MQPSRPEARARYSDRWRMLSPAEDRRRTSPIETAFKPRAPGNLSQSHQNNTKHCSAAGAQLRNPGTRTQRQPGASGSDAVSDSPAREYVSHLTLFEAPAGNSKKAAQVQSPRPRQQTSNGWTRCSPRAQRSRLTLGPFRAAVEGALSASLCLIDGFHCPSCRATDACGVPLALPRPRKLILSIP